MLSQRVQILFVTFAVSLCGNNSVQGCKHFQYFCNEFFEEIDPPVDDTAPFSLCLEPDGNYHIEDFIETNQVMIDIIDNPPTDSCAVNTGVAGGATAPVMTTHYSLGRIRLDGLGGDKVDIDGVLKCGNGKPLVLKPSWYAPQVLEENSGCSKYPIDASLADPIRDHWDSIEILTTTPTNPDGVPPSVRFPPETFPATLTLIQVKGNNGVWFHNHLLTRVNDTAADGPQISADIKAALKTLEICPGTDNLDDIQVEMTGKAKTIHQHPDIFETVDLDFMVPVIPPCVPSATHCCVDADCTNPYGGKCDFETHTCACDASKCEKEVSFTGGDKVCQASCDCPNDCDSATGTCKQEPLLNCDLCAFDIDSCQDGFTCDGKFCVPSGQCNSRKQQLCDNAYFTITGSPDQRSKCCPDSSGCVRQALKLGENSVCSTTCGTSCMGTINGQKDYPKVMCSFDNTEFAQFMEFDRCYEDVVQPYCQMMTSIGAENFDVSSDLCKNADGVVGGEAGCQPPLPDPDYAVCCARGHESQKSCDPNFVVPDEIPTSP